LFRAWDDALSLAADASLVKQRILHPSLSPQVKERALANERGNLTYRKIDIARCISDSHRLAPL